MKNSKELTKLVLETTRYSGDHAFFVKKFKKMKKNVKIIAFRGNSGNSGGDGLLNSNHRGTGRGKTAGDLGDGLLGFLLASLMAMYVNQVQNLSFLKCQCL